MDRAEVLNHLINVCHYQSYLEIGVREGHTFNQVKCAHKVSVDPLSPATYHVTSDQYFADHPDHRYDLVLVDGLHLEEQWLRDVHNSLKALNFGGTILCHDILPKHENMAGEHPVVSQWCGTVWRGWAKLRMTNPLIEQWVVSADHGLGLIQKGKQQLYPESKITWKRYAGNVELLHIITPTEFYNRY